MRGCMSIPRPGMNGLAEGDNMGTATGTICTPIGIAIPMPIPIDICIGIGGDMGIIDMEGTGGMFGEESHIDDPDDRTGCEAPSIETIDPRTLPLPLALRSRTSEDEAGGTYTDDGRGDPLPFLSLGCGCDCESIEAYSDDGRGDSLPARLDTEDGGTLRLIPCSEPCLRGPCEAAGSYIGLE